MSIDSLGKLEVERLIRRAIIEERKEIAEAIRNARLPQGESISIKEFKAFIDSLAEQIEVNY